MHRAGPMHKRFNPDIAFGLPGFSGDLLFILCVIGAYVPTFIMELRSFTSAEAIVLLVAGAAYVSVRMYAVPWLIRLGMRVGWPSAPVLYFTIQIPLGAAIIYTSHGSFLMGLIMMPLASMGASLPRRQTLIVCALLLIAIALPQGLRFGWGAAALVGIAWLPGIVFTVFVTQVAVGERKARAEVERLATELAEANRKLEEASRYKSAFLANMSHELRTPLNAIIGFSRLVMRRSQNILPAREYDNLSKILLSAEHLLTLINDILDLSKIEAGRMEIHPVRFDLEPLVDVCLRTVEPLVKSGQVRLTKDIEPNLPSLYTDQDRLQQILMNLLSNAAKFTEAGTIAVAAQCRDGRVAVAVADTGIGIPEDALERIFEEFRQVDTGTTRQYGGTGLGLSISRRLAQLLGGDIIVQSILGVGSTFTVTLPLHGAAAAPVKQNGVTALHEATPKG
jgi:signal transduction histidine kinase